MKKEMLFCILICAAMPWLCPGAEPQFQEGIKIQSNGQDIDIPVGHLVPCVADWNGDQKKDLIVGQFSEGKICLYLNQGTNEKPEFKGFTEMQAGGKPIRLDAG
jgi:hypothetical protein